MSRADPNGALFTNVVQKTDWTKVTRDVENFLENPSDMQVFIRENVLKLLSGH
jgi:hypothetical protein